MAHSPLVGLLLLVVCTTAHAELAIDNGLLRLSLSDDWMRQEIRTAPDESLVSLKSKSRDVEVQIGSTPVVLLSAGRLARDAYAFHQLVPEMFDLLEKDGTLLRSVESTFQQDGQGGWLSVYYGVDGEGDHFRLETQVRNMGGVFVLASSKTASQYHLVRVIEEVRGGLKD